MDNVVTKPATIGKGEGDIILNCLWLVGLFTAGNVTFLLLCEHRSFQLRIFLRLMGTYVVHKATIILNDRKEKSVFVWYNLKFACFAVDYFYCYFDSSIVVLKILFMKSTSISPFCIKIIFLYRVTNKKFPNYKNYFSTYLFNWLYCK